MVALAIAAAKAKDLKRLRGMFTLLIAVL